MSLTSNVPKGAHLTHKLLRCGEKSHWRSRTATSQSQSTSSNWFHTSCFFTLKCETPFSESHISVWNYITHKFLTFTKSQFSFVMNFHISHAELLHCWTPHVADSGDHISRQTTNSFHMPPLPPSPSDFIFHIHARHGKIDFHHDVRSNLFWFARVKMQPCHMWKVLKSLVTCEKFSERSHFARDSHPHHCISA